MTISTRTLRQWRKDALASKKGKATTIGMYEGTASGLTDCHFIYVERIIKLTQLLMDQKLLEEGK